MLSTILMHFSFLFPCHTRRRIFVAVVSVAIMRQNQPLRHYSRNIQHVANATCYMFGLQYRRFGPLLPASGYKHARPIFTPLSIILSDKLHPTKTCPGNFGLFYRLFLVDRIGHAISVCRLGPESPFGSRLDNLLALSY